MPNMHWKATVIGRLFQYVIHLKLKQIIFVTQKCRILCPKKFQNAELEAILADALGVDHSTVSKRLKAMAMISKQGNWVPYQLKPRVVERRYLTCELLLAR